MSISLIERAASHGGRTAVIAGERCFSYGELLEASAATAAALLGGEIDLQEARVGILTPSGFDYVATQWGIWRAGGVAVPLAPQHPLPELEHVADDAELSALIVHRDLADKARSLAANRPLRVYVTAAAQRTPTVALPEISGQRRAMILYTSGTTSKPKGVVTTHANVQAQIETLIDAWEWAARDHILHVLPLHHVHGIINVLCCALWAGAKCEFMPFDATAVWQRFVRGDLTLFMAVPTIYARLISAWEASPAGGEGEGVRGAWSAGCGNMRLMVSGSAALPVSTLEKWRTISGHVLLERYGMTEIGMALSNPLHGERVPGHVGVPLPGVEVRLVDDAGRPHPDAGEIEVRGPSVFAEYWRSLEATRAAFRDGWFRTGDMAIIENGSYRILGRKSVDIIKTGGYKVSALEIEEVLRTHPAIRECAVVGVPDAEWGERVAACVAPAAGRCLTLDELRDWAKDRLAVYKSPSRLLVVDDLPRNAMGKVQKPAVAALFDTPAGSTR